MHINKLITGIFFLLFFNGCVQSTVFLGPAITGAGTGSIYQSGLSYASSKTITVITKKTPIENLQLLLKSKKKDDSFIPEQ